ncbi:hypothetical protein EJP82_12155 [Paenibacillus anaericanus]|uniref:Uncharacterized protein n=1 Tax=Paenibacillus anaericanus TaxID=170367 RepID=A0A3S1C9F9_9BACL|nr:hypothetical protein [Paenibacillus anaericanus]RUT46595.1 hypothetical protein EJP82_12155 [Paenibacillus anaericanus]
MESIQFKVEHSQEDDYEILNIYINDENLIEFIKRFEMQFQPNIAGGYEGLNINFITDICEHFSGELNENDLFNYGGKTQILGCNCGEPGCWPLVVKITVKDQHIIWSDFEQPHRSEESEGGFWNYSQVAPLEFNRKVYEEQLKSIERYRKPYETQE